MCMYTHMYMYMYTHMYTYMYTYINFQGFLQDKNYYYYIYRYVYIIKVTRNIKEI